MTPEDLVVIRVIEELKYRYLRCLDLKRWDELEGLFTDDATASYGGGAWVFEGRAAIMRFLVDVLGTSSVLTSHKVHHPEIELSDDRSRATGIWALDDVVVNSEHGVTIRGAAFYADRYVRLDDHWLIEHTGYKRVYEEMYPRASVEGLKLTAEYWGTEGRSRLGPDESRTT
jgi:hypothetical protein